MNKNMNDGRQLKSAASVICCLSFWKVGRSWAVVRGEDLGIEGMDSSFMMSELLDENEFKRIDLAVL